MCIYTYVSIHPFIHPSHLSFHLQSWKRILCDNLVYDWASFNFQRSYWYFGYADGWENSAYIYVCMYVYDFQLLSASSFTVA